MRGLLDERARGGVVLQKYSTSLPLISALDSPSFRIADHPVGCVVVLREAVSVAWQRGDKRCRHWKNGILSSLNRSKRSDMVSEGMIYREHNTRTCSRRPIDHGKAGSARIREETELTRRHHNGDIALEGVCRHRRTVAMNIGLFDDTPNSLLVHNRVWRCSMH